jgi:hypothetical protein
MTCRCYRSGRAWCAPGGEPTTRFRSSLPRTGPPRQSCWRMALRTGSSTPWCGIGWRQRNGGQCEAAADPGYLVRDHRRRAAGACRLKMAVGVDFCALLAVPLERKLKSPAVNQTKARPNRAVDRGGQWSLASSDHSVVCRSNKGAPGVDGQDFADIEAYGRQRWLGELALALRQETYRPDPIRRVFIPKANGWASRPCVIESA